MPAQRSDAARWEGADKPPSPFRMVGADGSAGGTGVADGAPDSQSQSERLSGRRVRPSQDGGPFDQFAQPPSCHAMTQMMNSRRHIVLMPLSCLSPDAGDLCLRCRSTLGLRPPHAAALAAGSECGKAAAGRPASAGIGTAGGGRRVGNHRAGDQSAC